MKCEIESADLQSSRPNRSISIYINPSKKIVSRCMQCNLSIEEPEYKVYTQLSRYFVEAQPNLNVNYTLEKALSGKWFLIIQVCVMFRLSWRGPEPWFARLETGPFSPDNSMPIVRPGST